jgi:hypothetical protein
MNFVLIIAVMVIISSLYAGFYVWMRSETFGEGKKRRSGQARKKKAI